MSAPKLAGRFGVLAKVETTYGVFAAPLPATDGVLVAQRPDVEIDYVHDGSRNGVAPGTAAGLRSTAKAGRWGKLSLLAEAAGAGVAYSASVVPSVHTLLRGAGFTPTFTATAGSEKYAYKPSAEGSYEAISLEAYQRAQKYQLYGCYGQLSIEGEAGKVPLWTFEYMGGAEIPGDAALAAITYAGAQAQEPAIASKLALTIGAFSPLRVKSFKFSQDRGISARALDNTSGKHGGFCPGAERNTTLEVLVEATALAAASPYHTANSLHPWQLSELATALPVSLVVGSKQYNRWTLTADAAQLVKPAEQDENNASMWLLTFACRASTYAANDEVTLTFD